VVRWPSEMVLSLPVPDRRDRPRTSYHSFRHNLRDRLREAQVSDELVDTLMGWTRRTMRETYGSGPSVNALDEAVSRVSYRGLDLSHVYVR
jgi:hypothetical protein